MKNTKASKPSLSAKSNFRNLFLTAMGEQECSHFDKDFLNTLAGYHEGLSINRRIGDVSISVTNPSLKSHGWNGPHTIVNIVCDDMAFIIDSVTALLSEKALLIEQILHPLLFVKKNSKGQNETLSLERQAGLSAESHMYIQLSRRLTDTQRAELENELLQTLEDVRIGTKDWLSIKARVKAAASGLKNAKGLNNEELSEYMEFLDYIHDDNFTLLGCLSYKVTGQGATAKISPIKGTGLGLLSTERKTPIILPTDEQSFVLNAKAKSGLAEPLYITKLSSKSTVHRRVPLDAVTIRQYDANGTLNGEILVIGLFTSVTYSRSIPTLPLLRYKAGQIIRKTGYEDNSHSSRALRHILEKYPRDELFQISINQLYSACMSIMLLQERPRIALYTRTDPFGRNISCLVYIPRDRFDTRARIKFSLILEEELGATCTSVTSTVDDSPLVRVSYVLNWNDGAAKKLDIARIEDRLQQEGRSWAERLGDDLAVKLGDEDSAAELADKYGAAFPAAYREMYKSKQAVHDISQIETVVANQEIALMLYKPYTASGRELSLKVYCPGTPLALSDILPTLENMGLKVVAEYPFEIHPVGIDQPVWIQDFLMEVTGASDTIINKDDILSIKDQFEACLKGVWSGTVENDGLNRLTLLAKMPWRDIVILRSYIRYMRQTNIPYSLPYMEQALYDHPATAHLLTELFHLYFNPSLAGKKTTASAITTTKSAIDQNLQSVTSLDQDRILRTLNALVEATLRTNFFQLDENGAEKPYLSIKLNSKVVPEIPEPRPYREIFVYSPRVEAIHLRMDKISRGGIRWSDRGEDFRTEVLGLMKAQQVKNSVIVPMGAKGGFFVKRPPKAGNREAIQKEGVECYRTLIRGMLDLTDNQKGNKIVPPNNVIRRDEDDPYIVAAADKGTATFSDIANALSLEYGFWLGDAFASGGSAGYDHKKMGITARGSWESVKRHFREINHDTQTQDFTVVGVGDMGGDVFGNGMLQSRKIRLIGAFNHMHIVCDPNPDPEVTYKERQRLFNEVKGWDQYDTKKLSKGGRIFLRSEKTLSLTPEIQKCFNINKSSVTPSELIQAMLTSETDLLYFGGIGTYIKASSETHQNVGDRSNDALRVNAKEVRAKIIGEGANLGMTQRARIEYAQNGGRLNTDFIDNSAGVDTSDHEVNIKILLSAVQNNPKAKMDTKARNKLLSSMTDEIAGLVLRDNYQQTQALSLMELQAPETLSEHASFMTSLEKAGLLNRKVEFLPDDEEIEARRKQGKGLTRPELSLILSYGKITYTSALMETSLLDDPAMLDWAVRYFPEAMQKKYRKEIEEHRLRRQIIATAISNGIINRLGPTFIRMTMEKTGADCEGVTNAYMVARDAFGLRPLWDTVESFDNKVPALVQLQAQRKIARLAERTIVWFLTRLGRTPNREKDGALFGQNVEMLRKNLESILPQDMKANFAHRISLWKENGLPDKLARDVALLPILSMAPDIIKTSQTSKTDLLMTAKVYFAIGSRFHLENLRQKALALPAENSWSQAAISGMVEQLYSIQADITSRVLKDLGKKKLGNDILDVWVDTCCPAAKASQSLIEDLGKKGALDMSMLMVIEQSLRRLI